MGVCAHLAGTVAYWKYGRLKAYKSAQGRMEGSKGRKGEGKKRGKKRERRKKRKKRSERRSKRKQEKTREGRKDRSLPMFSLGALYNKGFCVLLLILRN